MYVGDVIKLKRSILMNPLDTIGICYETYERDKKEFVASFIFENGIYEGFSLKEMNDFLHLIGHSDELENYEFFNEVVLQQDFKNGMFDSVLKKKKYNEIDYNILKKYSGSQ